MTKIDENFVVQEYNSSGGIENYSTAIENIWLWKSEQILFKKYFNKSDTILDVGCGAGRTTFGLYSLWYEYLTWIDLSENLITFAKSYAHQHQYILPFMVGNVLQLPFEEKSFDKAIFSFNGLMCIPNKEKRLQAIKEIRRVLKDWGVFIFTTHDRDDSSGKKYFEYWKQEEQTWNSGGQDSRLFELGDRIVHGNWMETFIHVANQQEVYELIEKSDFFLIETVMRWEIAEESSTVKDFSGECRFWVVKK